MFRISKFFLELKSVEKCDQPVQWLCAKIKYQTFVIDGMI